MNRFAMLLAALLLPLAAHAGDSGDTQVQFERNVSGQIEIAPDGSVSDYSLDSELGLPEVTAALHEQIGEWRFEPILVDGKPVAAQANMNVQLALVPLDDERMAFRIERVAFGSPGRTARMAPPRYPDSALRERVAGKVTLVLKLDDDGGVERVHVERVDLERSTQSESRKEHWREVFAAAATRAARKWRFEPGARLGGEPLASSIRVPVEFVINTGMAAADRWRAYEPGPYQPAPWARPDADAAAHIAGLKDGDVQPLDSPFRLLGDVVGSFL